MFTETQLSGKGLIGPEMERDAAGSAEPALEQRAPGEARVTVHLLEDARISPNVVQGAIGVLGPDGFGIIPNVTALVAEHHGNIDAMYKTRLGKNVHGSHCVFVASEEAFRRINAEINAHPLWTIDRPLPGPIQRDCMADLKIIVLDGERIVCRVAGEVEDRGIFIRTMACSTFTPPGHADIPACWRAEDGAARELGIIDMKLEMADEAMREIEALADKLWHIGERRWDIRITETSPWVENPSRIERRPLGEERG